MFRTINAFIIMVFLSVFLFNACSAPKASRKRQGEMDNPAFHSLRGDDHLFALDYQKAALASQRSLDLNPDFSPALSGLAVTQAHQISVQANNSSLEEQIETIEDLLELARESSKNVKNRIRARSYAVQAYWEMRQQDEDWYEKAGVQFEEATEMDPQDPMPYFFMARAESARFNYSASASNYNQVLNIGRKYAKQANQELEIVQKIQRAQPGSPFGKTVAWVPEISKADVSALFIAELRLERMFEARNQEENKGFEAPKQQQNFKPQLSKGQMAAMDIEGHPMQNVIEDILKIGIKGLETDPTGKFYPNHQITRAEFALMLQDVLVQVTRDQSIETRYIGESSPFPDVRPDLYYYNAARVVVSRNLMPVADKASGKFKPKDPVRGADALLVIRDLKDMLSRYVR